MQARRMGYRVATLSPDEDTPTGQISDTEINASYDDLDAVKKFAQSVDAVTIEFENIPAKTLETVSEIVPVRPGASVLHTTQQRVREKSFLMNKGFPLARFACVRSEDELLKAVAEIKTPCVLKSADWGYDGKGQRMIYKPEDASAAYKDLKTSECVLEEFIDLECEVSVVAARGTDGEIVHYGVVENFHEHHILNYTFAPSSLDETLSKQAVQIATSVLEELNVVGVMCVEMFVTKQGKLLINELAPRPHNSGHWTIDACVVNQFEQQLRAVCNLPLGSTQQTCAAAMVNLLGDVWQAGEPRWEKVLALPNVKLHLYGKREARAGRKMGHLTALDTASHTTHGALTALKIAQAARELLKADA